ncbi:unnamed protein product [Ambrosiozyma monospora]|uniref:Unnamed protein product n=1 Tax=Ambrosiozyma monospora TaxID=43982 RepID=A0ACB5STR8_AMBMO|nr:unnamed protein product [Ambrosiozyma monospora]
MKVKLSDEEKNVSMVIEFKFLYAPGAGGSFLCEAQLLPYDVDFRRMRRVPFSYFGPDYEHRMQLIQHTDTPVFKDGSIVLPNVPAVNIPVRKITICVHVHKDFGHISNGKLLESARNGTIVLTEPECEELTRDNKCEECINSKATNKNPSAGSRDKYMVEVPFFIVCSDVCQVATKRVHRSIQSLCILLLM